LDDVTRREKRLLVDVNGETKGMALVDACISADMFIAAKAVWQVEQLRELYVTFASSEAIGLSSIASLVHPVGRDEDHGLGMQMDPEANQKVIAPVAPGLFAQLGIERWDELQLGSTWTPTIDRGVIALDGEREIEFRAVDNVRLSLDRFGPSVIDVSKALGVAAKHGIMIQSC